MHCQSAAVALLKVSCTSLVLGMDGRMPLSIPSALACAEMDGWSQLTAGTASTVRILTHLVSVVVVLPPSNNYFGAHAF